MIDLHAHKTSACMLRACSSSCTQFVDPCFMCTKFKENTIKLRKWILWTYLDWWINTNLFLNHELVQRRRVKLHCLFHTKIWKDYAGNCVFGAKWLVLKNISAKFIPDFLTSDLFHSKSMWRLDHANDQLQIWLLTLSNPWNH